MRHGDNRVDNGTTTIKTFTRDGKRSRLSPRPEGQVNKHLQHTSND
jgi:hypothetical protein